MTNFVLGFCFSEDTQRIVLIAKNKPEWQKGKLNGVGGAITDADHSPWQAMLRKFEEETGVKHYTSRAWQLYATLIGEFGSCHCFRLFSSPIVNAVRTVKEEEVLIKNPHNLYTEPRVHNLDWLLALALDKDTPPGQIIRYFKKGAGRNAYT